MDVDTPGEAPSLFVAAREKFSDLRNIQGDDLIHQQCVEIFEFLAADKDKRMVAEIEEKFAGQARLSAVTERFLELQVVCSKIITLKYDIKTAEKWNEDLKDSATYFYDLLSVFFDARPSAERLKKETTAFLGLVNSLYSFLTSEYFRKFKSV